MKFLRLLPCFLALLALAGCGGGGGSDPVPPPVLHAISGAVSGSVASGVTVTLSGASNATTTTGAGGAYAFSGLSDGSYTMTPSLPGHTFAPASLAVTVAGTDVTGRNFVASAVPPPTHAISGAVSGSVVSGVTVTLSGASSATTTTGAGGSYSFGGLADGSYTVTPSAAGHAFTPAFLAVTLAGADVTGRDFVARSPGPHDIAGSVSGAIRGMVTVRLSGPRVETQTTLADGTFRFRSLADGDYTITPTYSGYTFSPSSRVIRLAGGDVLDATFTSAIATQPTYLIMGRVSGAAANGVAVTLSGGAAASTTTNASGAFMFTGLAAGNYVVTPSLGGLSFEPISTSITIASSDYRTACFVSNIVSPAPWRFVPSGCSEDALHAVSGTGPADAWAVGFRGRILHWNGSNWQGAVDSTPGNLLSGVWASAPGDAWAVGDQNGSPTGVVTHWDGAAWTSSVVANGSPTFRAIHGCSATDVWAVGLQNFSVPPGIAYHWNGATWTASGPFLDHLNAVWCTSPSDVWAVGNYGRIAHWNGQAWTENPLDSITARAFYAVWASGPQDAWAAGLTFPGEETTLFHWDGISWTKATTGTSLTVSSLWGSGPADVWALAGNVVLHYDGTAWSEEPIGAAVALSQIWGSGSGDIWAVGEGGIIMHRQ